MSIQNQINRITDNIADAYTAVGERGGTLPSSLNSANLANAIESIPVGVVTVEKNTSVEGVSARYTIKQDGTAVVGGVIDVPKASISVDVTLQASAWNNGQQTVSVTGLKANQNGFAALSQDCTSEEYDALVAAELYISGQGANSLSFTANGEIPNINIPITVILLG